MSELVQVIVAAGAIGVSPITMIILATSLGKRIGDLRSQMKSGFEQIDKRLSRVEGEIDSHINDRSLHN